MNRQLTPEFFFSNFFIEPNQINYEQIIERDIQKPKRFLVLYGYRGCGKTTFMHHLEDIFKYNMILISIDENYYEVDPIRSQLVTYLLNKIIEDKDNGLKIFNKFLDVFNSETNKRFFLVRIDEDDGFDNFINMIISFSNRNLSNDDILAIKRTLMGKRISFLLMMIIFHNLSERLLNNNTNKVFFCLDNTDAIENIDFLKEFMSQYLIFRNNVSFILDNISYEDITIKNINRIQDYYFIITARESTKAKMNAHFNIDYINMIEYINLSTTFSKTDIFSRRISYLAQLKDNQFHKNRIENFKLLFNDSLFSSIFPSMFNNDYRKILHVASILSYNQEEFDKYRNLMDLDTPYTKYGARGIIFRLIFKYFYKEEESKIIIQNQVDVMNILGYLNNNDNRYTDAVYDDPTISRDLLSLSEDFQTILENKDFVSLLFTMYNLKDSNSLAHLVTFDRLRKNDLSEINNQKDLIRLKEDDSSKFAKIRITCAGEIFLKYMISHFEFLSIQSGNKEYLFSEKNLNKRRERYGFELIIDNVYKEVKELLHKIKKISRDKYLGSLFSYYEQVEDEAKVANVHIYERIIFTHIGYIDHYRLYILKCTQLNELEKCSINEKLIDHITLFMDIFKDFESSPYARDICDNMLTCILKIIDSKYKNWDISIDDKTGELLKENSTNV